MKNVSIKICGTIGGVIWLPAVQCSKEFSQTYRPTKDLQFALKDEWVGLRKALLDITNCGDFQNCGIVDATMIVRIETARGVYAEHWIELTPADSRIADLFVKNPEDFSGFGD